MRFLWSTQQLERLRSENTPLCDYPYYWPVPFESQVHTIDQFISDPKSKEIESRKNRKIGENFKFKNFVLN